MLQRMGRCQTTTLLTSAEDMEYDGCLTVAAEERDPLKRIAFVGAFAMASHFTETS